MRIGKYRLIENELLEEQTAKIENLSESVSLSKTDNERFQSELEAAKEEIQSLKDGIVSLSTSEAVRIDPLTAEGFRRLTSSSRKGISNLDQDTVLSLVRFLYRNNPLARRLIEANVDYCYKMEIQASKKAPKRLAKLLNEFWNDPYNDMKSFIPQIIERLMLDGEVLLPVNINPQTGLVRLQFEEPDEIKDFVRMQGDKRYFSKVLMKVNLSTDGTVENKRESYRVINYQIDPEATVIIGSEQLGNQKEVSAYEYRTGDAFYFRLGSLISERGRPPLESVIDWLDAHDRAFFDQLRNIILQSFYFLDVSIEDATPEQILLRQEQIRTEGAPKHGSIRIHSSKEKWTPLSPELNAQVTESMLTESRRVAGLGTGKSETFVAASKEINRATAEIADTPPLKNLERMNSIFVGFIRFIVEFQLDMFILHGRYSVRKPSDRDFTIVGSDITTTDSARTAQALLNLSSALTTVVRDGICTKETAIQIFYKTAGEELPSEDEMSELEQITLENQQKETNFGNGNQNGNSNGNGVFQPRHEVSRKPGSGTLPALRNRGG